MYIMAEEIISDANYKKFSDYQTKVKDITVQEISRVQSKKAQLYEQDANAKRMVLLNTSYRDKQKQYVLMILVIVLTSLLIFGLFMLKSTFEIKSQFIELFILIVLVGGIISVFFIYMDILSRDNIYFDKLNKDSLMKIKDMSGNKVNLNASTTSITTGITCKGAECCGPGYIYDVTKNMCKRK